MESGGHRSGSGAVSGSGGAEGAQCHACGYHYPNGHPSAKQRRAHRKHCGSKPASAAADEGEGRVLFPGEGGGAAVVGGGGDGIGAGAAELGGGVPGSAREDGSAAVDVDNTEHSSHDGAGAQVIIDKFLEDHSGIASEITPKTNRTDDGGTLNDVATQHSGKASLSEEGSPYVPASAVTSEQLQTISAPVLPPEPGYSEGVSPELSVSELQHSNVVSLALASDATGGEISEQSNDVITEPNGTNVTGVESMANTIDNDIPIERKTVNGDHLDSFYQENVESEAGEGHSNTGVEEDASGKKLSEEIPNDEPELNHQSSPILTNSVERVPNTEEPVKSGTQVPVAMNDFHLEATDTVKPEEQSDSTSLAEDRLAVPEQTDISEGEHCLNTGVEEDASGKKLSEDIPNDEPESSHQNSPILTSSDVLIPNTEEPVMSGTQVPVGTDDFHLDATDTVSPQERPDSTSVAEDHLAVPEPADISEGEHCLNKDGTIEIISSATGPAINAEVISVGGTDNIKNVSLSDISIGESIKENVTSNTVVPSQADLVDLSSAAHEINMVNSTNDVEEKGQNEKSITDPTTHDLNKARITDLVEEKQHDKDIIADSTSHETSAVSSMDDYGENENGAIAETNSCNIPSMSNIKEEKQVEEVISNPAPEKDTMSRNIDGVEENKQIEVDVQANRERSMLCTAESTEEKVIISDNKAENITNNAEDKKQSEEISAGDISDSTSMIYSPVNEEKMHNVDMTEDSSSHEKTMVHSTDNVGEKHEMAVMDPTSHSIGMVTRIDCVEERKNGETSEDITSHRTNATHITDNVEEKKDIEPILEPALSKIETVGGTDDVKEKQKNEETTAEQISGENNTLQSAYDAETGMQNKDATTIAVSDKSEATNKTDTIEGTEQKEEVAAKEISTTQSTDDLKEADQNAEVADKEVIVDSDRSHVSLKVLLADKNVEAKEKKPSTKDRVLSFRRRSSSKDNESPVKPGSPKAGSGQQDWNSPARLPAEKKSKGKKQQWVPFICCSSMH